MSETLEQHTQSTQASQCIRILHLEDNAEDAAFVKANWKRTELTARSGG